MNPTFKSIVFTPQKGPWYDNGFFVCSWNMHNLRKLLCCMYKQTTGFRVYESVWKQLIQNGQVPVNATSGKIQEIQCLENHCVAHLLTFSEHLLNFPLASCYYISIREHKSAQLAQVLRVDQDSQVAKRAMFDLVRQSGASEQDMERIVAEFDDWDEEMDLWVCDEIDSFGIPYIFELSWLTLITCNINCCLLPMKRSSFLFVVPY